MPYQRLHGRMDRLQEQHPPRPRSSVDWSRLTDGELERLEPIALQVMAGPDVTTALSTLAPADKAWLATIAAKLDRLDR